MSGGCGSAFSISAADPRRRRTTARTNGCTRRSRRRRFGRPAPTLAPQQRAFNRFRAEYNDERPHQFLEGATPASRYRTSPRLYTGTLPPIEYPGHFIVKRITNAGTFRFKKQLLFIANSLKQHTIGLEEVGRRHLVDSFLSGPAGTGR